MHYTSSTHFSFLWNFLHLCLLHQIQSPHNPASGNHKSDLLWVYLSVFEQYWPSILCELLVHNIVIQYFIHFKVIIMINLVTICQHTKISCNYWLSSPQCAFHMPLTYLFCNWEFVPVSLLHLILSFFHPLLLYSHLFILWIYPVSLLWCLFSFQIPHINEIYTLSVFIYLTYFT